MKIKFSIIAWAFGWLGLVAPVVGSSIQSGDRIAIVGNTFADQLRIHGYLESQLLHHTKDSPVSIRNLGWGGDTLNIRARPTNFPTEESTLTAHGTDVIIACFGLGESFSGVEGLPDFKRDLEQFVASHAGKSYNGKSEVRLILVSPLAYENLGGLTPEPEKRNRELAAYTSAMSEVAAAQQLPFIDLYEDSQKLMEDPLGPNLTTNGIHLTPYGYWAVSQSFFNQLTRPVELHRPAAWRVNLDVESKSADGVGVEVSDVSFENAGIKFRVAESSAPSLAPPVDQPIPAQLAEYRDTLVVENLPAGIYQLEVDGVAVATGPRHAWAEGVAIDASPAHQAGEAYRAMVNDKNLQFTYSWKALNQVHIVGERRRSPSGRELPREVIEFNELANGLDQVLSEGIELKTRQWSLTRISE